VVRELDLNKYHIIKKFVKEITDEFHNVDVLINNAGIAYKK
jgi:NADP-dependent 3-hydroxy acid dehydrogenase YdfG